MDYSLLKSVIAASKNVHTIKRSSESFAVVDTRARPYIEPDLEKIIFDQEKPTVLLVSAVGATGKTALAHQLSRDLSLPVLDLAKHKPVGDNTLTGILTSTFDVGDISTVLAELQSGQYAVIIDGIDEGRSKTTEKAFDAFLDDVAKLCQGSPSTTFVLLGRTQILDDCWSYLTDKGVPTALVTISPFTLANAKTYIDTFTQGAKGTALYTNARDTLLDQLSRAFVSGRGDAPDAFLSFIGYPPILDAVATLLSEEQNYHRLLQELTGPSGSDVEIALLRRISEYVLTQERDDKAIPNIVRPIIEGAPDSLRVRALANAFSIDEQAARLVAYCLNKQLALHRLQEPLFDERYERQLEEWLPEHPFLAGREFRNAVFEALALATLATSGNEDFVGLLEEYTRAHKASYHLVYMLDVLTPERVIPPQVLRVLFAAALEFQSRKSSVALRIEASEWDETYLMKDQREPVAIEIEIAAGDGTEDAQTFEFTTTVEPTTTLVFGPRLGGVLISIPCRVQIDGSQEVELTAPIDIRAGSIALTARELILRRYDDDTAQVDLHAESLESSIESITTNGIPLTVELTDTAGVTYPIVQHIEQSALVKSDPLFRKKYMRLKRILLEFRSHSKGRLARYRNKIESVRVLKNETGRAVLDRLVADGILYRESNFYFVNPDELARHVGASWQDLRRGRIPATLEHYIKQINIS